MALFKKLKRKVKKVGRKLYSAATFAPRFIAKGGKTSLVNDKSIRANFQLAKTGYQKVYDFGKSQNVSGGQNSDGFPIKLDKESLKNASKSLIMNSKNKVISKIGGVNYTLSDIKTLAHQNASKLSKEARKHLSYLKKEVTGKGFSIKGLSKRQKVRLGKSVKALTNAGDALSLGSKYSKRVKSVVKNSNLDPFVKSAIAKTSVKSDLDENARNASQDEAKEQSTTEKAVKIIGGVSTGIGLILGIRRLINQ